MLVNVLIANVTGTFLSFALTFWVYLETKSVLAAALLSGFSMIAGSLTGPWFGALVDSHRKKSAMVAASVTTAVAYAGAALVFAVIPTAQLVDWSGAWFWIFCGFVVVGSLAGGLRGIALSTTVTLLIPADQRDKANGLVGTVNGLAHMTTSVFSGLAVGLLGMGGTVVIAVGLTVVSLVHLLPIRIDEPQPSRAADGTSSINIRGTWATVRAVPGLVPLILFSTFNNLVMGVFMTLMDPYGLTLFSVQSWGLVLGVTSTGFIAGGALVARYGLGRNPIRTLLLANVGIALVGIGTAVREWQLLLVVGMFGFMILIPVAEAAEQTVMQRVVPFEMQGRVFGFAQSVETASTPLAAFVIGPMAQLFIIPFMASDQGRSTFGPILGDGVARGMALTFVVASLVMLIAVLRAFSSRAYRQLSASYDDQPEPAHVAPQELATAVS
ncbi:multidrug transporter [Luteipulveratus mongoliensis]|uniref:Multidrug transporter n=1 Tax=Luteipulveratus mongoliensis TaxID=571913 RepID=A0A0K1JPL6_9MICO|nr:multidrug transporter [Luteipulveratus mongoliensis]